jgi:hypothetical protein
MNRRVLVACLFVSLLAACSEPAAPATPSTKAVATTSVSTPAPPSPTPAPTPAVDSQDALKTAVVDYTNAYFAADWDTAFTRLWSARCKADNEARNSFIGTLAAQKVNYPDANKPRAGDVTVDRIDGDVGIVTYSFSYNGQSQTIDSQPWILEDGHWHYDDC